MKKIMTIALALLSLIGAQAQNISLDKPVRRVGNDFAIVIDNTSYSRITGQVLAYRDALQDDGLSTWILRGDWQSPDQLRDQLKALYKKAKKLEGIVLVGDIPVVMVRNAQHFTTAFKMDEENFDRTESSVGSDRFYDSLDLEWEYLDKDDDFFYYKLREDSVQKLNPTFYSGRIKYPPMLGGDKYEAIGRFLDKAVEAKRNPQDLDNIVTFAGHGYNSDCLNAWMDEDILIDECFPGVKRDRDHLRQLNFRMDTFMKYRLFDELQRPEVDAFFFNEHGSIDKQHISGGRPKRTAEDYLDELKWGYGEMYMAVREMAKDKDTTEVIAYLKDKYNLTDKFFEDFWNDSLKVARREAAAAERAETVISLEDLTKVATQPRFVMFNACYNGSFHRPGSIASYYIFGSGRTVACQGNTVNVLQDRWTYENVGLLSAGCRVGEYNRFTATLEGHIIGDPTFHFNPVGEKWRGSVAAHRGDVRFWRKALGNSQPSVRSTALRLLWENGAIGAPELLQRMKDEPAGTVRMECLKLLSQAGGDEFVDGILLGLEDNYELVRRNAAIMSGKCGDPRLEEAMERVHDTHPEDARVAFNLETSMRIMSDKALKASLRKIQDKEASERSRIMQIRTVRNSTMHGGIPEFLAIIADDSEPVAVRVNMAEALGWFTMSYRKAEIIDGCQRILDSGQPLPEELRGELTQTILRLQ